MNTYISVRGLLTDKIEKYAGTFALYKSTTEEKIKNIQKKLIQAGLSQFEVELLMSRFIEEKSFKEIVKEQGWTSLGSASHYLRSALSKLKKGNFEL